ncbi:MAG: RecX family transcriptional regulator [Oscillospiraceae bacterium]|jgi:SOS response regulatory protein OraA/RecX|nr:RecX family transcriptional regulator [Oscillospiraceae bacterium]
MTTKTDAVRAAAALLAGRDYSSLALSEKLAAKGFDCEEITRAVAVMTERGYINDARRARNLAESLRARNYGQWRVREALRREGLEEYIEDAGAEGDAKAAIAALLAKMRGKSHRAVSAALLRRGFDHDDILAALGAGEYE